MCCGRMGRKFKLSQRKGYQTSKPKQQPPNEEEDTSCSTIVQSVVIQTDISFFNKASVAVQTDVSCFDESSVTVQTDVSCFDESSVAIQTDMSCFDEVSPIAISLGLEFLSMCLPFTSQL